MAGERKLPSAATPRSAIHGGFPDRLRRYREQGGRRDAAIVLLSLSLVAVIWFITIERVAYERRETEENVVKQNSNLALALEEHTIRTLRSVDQALAQVAREYREEGTKLDIARFIADGAIDDQLFHNIGVLDEQGRLVAAQFTSAMDFQDREYFKVHQNEVIGRMYIGQPLLGRITGEWAIHMSRRINKLDGSFGGVAFASVDPHYFTGFYARADLGHNGLVNLVGLDGVTRARRAGDKESFGQGRGKSSLLAEQAKAPIGNFLTKGEQEGVPRFQSYRTLNGYRLIVAVGTSQAEALAEFYDRRRGYFLWSGLGTLLIALFAAQQIAARVRRRRAQEEVALKNTILSTQQEVSLDAILVVDEDAKILSYNQKFIDMWRIPAELVRAGDDRPVLQMVVGRMRDPEEFLARVDHLYKLREEKSSEEIHTKDGRTIDRYSAPIVGANGQYHGRIWYFRDVTDRKRSEEALRRNAERLERAQRVGRVGDWTYDLKTGAITWSEQTFRIFGRDPGLGPPSFDEFLGLLTPDSANHLKKNVQAAIETGEPQQYELWLKAPDGSPACMYTQLVVEKDAEGRAATLFGTAHDVTERKQAEAQLRLSAQAFENIADGIIVTDAEKHIVSVNPAFTTITGYSAEEVVGRSPQYFQSGRHDAAFYAGMWQEISRAGYWRGEIWDRRKNGEVYPQLLSISTVKNSLGTVMHYVGVSTDISSLKRYEAQLLHQAHHDALTGLPNRTLFQDRFRETLGRARRHNHQAAVLFLDLDRFKTINDSLGHDVGDLLLQAVAKRLTAIVREVDTVGRFGGDEFAVLLDVIQDNLGAGTVAHKLLDAMAGPFQLAGHEVYMSVSIGISCFPQDGADAETLFKNADAAMYLAKAEGRNKYQFFSADMNARALENLLMSNNLRLALQRDELLLHYQPHYDLKSGRITGAEALVRWRHPELELVPPARFIPLAEETGLIEPIGEWVLKTACVQMRAWQDAGLPLCRIAVNLSARQFRNPGLVQRIAAILEETRLPAHFLELEVTESMVMQNPESTAAVLTQLKSMGISIAIDDFGTGYSSLSYLKRFPIDYLKIDQSFVSGIPHDADDAAITKAIIALAKSLNLKLIAEGVETEEQRAFLERQGCDEAQGYLFSRPVPAGDIPALTRFGASRAVPAAALA